MGYLLAYTVAIASMLAGAAVVHNIYAPDLVSIKQLIARPAPFKYSFRLTDRLCHDRPFRYKSRPSKHPRSLQACLFPLKVAGTLLISSGRRLRIRMQGTSGAWSKASRGAEMNNSSGQSFATALFADYLAEYRTSGILTLHVATQKPSMQSQFAFT